MPQYIVKTFDLNVSLTIEADSFYLNEDFSEYRFLGPEDEEGDCDLLAVVPRGPSILAILKEQQ